MTRSKIEWTAATWNPVRGCSRVSEGCRNCYAERMAARFSKPGEPFRVFVNSMSDLFHEALPASAIDRVFAVMADARAHTFQVLTKRPKRMLAYLSGGPQPAIGGWLKGNHHQCVPDQTYNEWPLPNVWLGVSVEDQKTADERIPLLLRTPAALRFVSYEPALGPVDFRRWLRRRIQADYDAIVARFPDMEPPPAHLQRPTDGIDWSQRRRGHPRGGPAAGPLGVRETRMGQGRGKAKGAPR